MKLEKFQKPRFAKEGTHEPCGPPFAIAWISTCGFLPPIESQREDHMPHVVLSLQNEVSGTLRNFPHQAVHYNPLYANYSVFTTNNHVADAGCRSSTMYWRFFVSSNQSRLAGEQILFHYFRNVMCGEYNWESTFFSLLRQCQIIMKKILFIRIIFP